MWWQLLLILPQVVECAEAHNPDVDLWYSLAKGESTLVDLKVTPWPE